MFLRVSLHHTLDMQKIDIRQVFGENVRYYRKKMGLSQEALSERLDISPNHLSVIETGGKFVTYKLLERMIEVFDVMPASLFFTPGTAGFDDSDTNVINNIIKSELDETAIRIQSRINETL